MSSLIDTLAHAGEVHAEPGSESVLSWLWHRPTWAGLIVIIVILACLYTVTRLLKLSFPARLLVVVATAIVIGVLYLPHNPTITAVTLSVGFVSCFLLTFTMLAGKSK